MTNTKTRVLVKGRIYKPNGMIYRLFVGLNDKDSKVQEIATETAYDLVKRLAARRFMGATLWETEGVFTHEDDTQVTENTIACELVFIDELAKAKRDVKSFVQELKELLNQESICVQCIDTQANFW